VAERGYPERMRVDGSERAAEVIERVRERRQGVLSITLGTGCCESTAPFLYEDYPAGPDAERVGEVAGVPVMAPAVLRGLYREDETLVVDVIDELAESLSIETDLGVRLVLRSPEQVAETLACEVPVASTREHTGPDPGASQIPGRAPDLPEGLRHIRIR
jgi:uncharacterized protein (DUF779 family)